MIDGYSDYSQGLRPLFSYEATMSKKRRIEPTVRVNITVPVSLKKRMDECPNITWSHVAVRAFEEQLAETKPNALERKYAKELKKITDDMAAVTEMLLKTNTDSVAFRSKMESTGS